MKFSLSLLMGLVGAVSSAAAAPMSYNINFTGTGLLPTSGSFTYDLAANTYSNFTVVWAGNSYDFLSLANGETDTTADCPGADGKADLFHHLTTGCHGTRGWDATFDHFRFKDNPTNFYSYDVNGPFLSVDGVGEFTVTAAVPEPTTFALGIAGVMLMAWRRTQRGSHRIHRKTTS